MIPLPFIESAAAEHVWQASLQAGLLVLVVLALRALLGSRLGPRWRVALWLLVFARLALVVAPPAPFSLFNLAPLGSPVPTAAPIDVAARPSSPGGIASTQESAAGSIAEPPAAPGRPTDVRRAPLATPGSMLLGAWALGAAFLAFAVLLGHAQVARQLRRARPCVNGHVLRLLEECRDALGVRTPIRALESEQVGSPVLVGVIRPALLVPAGLAARLGGDGLRAVLMHEVAHVKRRDIAVGWGATALLILHWFNPLVWIAMSRLRADREMACDELALSRLGATARSSYGTALIELLHGAGPPRLLAGAAAILERPRDVEKRIKMIATFRPKSFRTDLVAALLFGCFAGVGLTDAMPRAQATRPPAPVPLLDGGRGAAAGMTAREVLLRAAKAYREARTYQDEGEVTTLYIHEHRTRTEVRPFSTAFVRAGELRELFRYEFQDGDLRDPRRYVVWSDGERIRSWWTVQPDVKELDGFSIALGPPGPISGGSATKIPGLLIAGMRSDALDLIDPEISGVEAVDGVRCIQITGMPAISAIAAEGTPVHPTHLWVDAESFLLRRIVERSHVDPARLREQVPSAYEGMKMGPPGAPFDVERTLDYRPRLDQDVPRAQLDFEPPR